MLCVKLVFSWKCSVVDDYKWQVSCRLQIVTNTCLFCNGSNTETLCSPLAHGMNTSCPQNFCGKHPTRPPMYMDPYLPVATPTPQGGLLKPLLLDPGVDSSSLHELNQPSSCEPAEQVRCARLHTLQTAAVSEQLSILVSPFPILSLRSQIL